jgi:hypothetical protein
MFNSIIHSFTHLRGFNASPTMPKAARFGGICRIDWSMKGSIGCKQVNFSTISGKNINSPMHPQLDNC